MEIRRQWILTIQLCLTLAGTTVAQDAQRPKVRAQEATAKPKTQKLSAEEKVIREVYEKLSTYHKAEHVFKHDRSDNSPIDEVAISFSFKDFRSGPIREILQKRYVDVVTLPTGDVVSLTRGVYTLNKGPEEVTFDAEWVAGRYASVFDLEWTIADVVNLEAARYFDIGTYTSYTATVTLAGRSRTYKALVLFHNLLKPNERGEPDFWDPIVNEIYRVWQENRPPYKAKFRSENSKPPEQSLVITPAPASYSPAEMTADLASEPAPLNDGDPLAIVQEAENTEPTEAAFGEFWLGLDDTEHASGNHGGTAQFTPLCSLSSTTTQRCEVAISNFALIETGTLDTFFFTHAGNKDHKKEIGLGPLGTNVTCASAAGVAFSSCAPLTSCQVNVSVGLSVIVGTASASIVGGNMWRDVHTISNTCHLGVAGGTCTTPAFDGSCPIGTTMNISGMCCTSSTESECSLETLRCLRFAGDFDYQTCGCITSSPIVVDVNGDGIALSGAADGVDFDINGNGTRDRLAWTRENSDDAWLALDRNGNNTIETGAELFGNYSPQPDASNKNGFLALAEFDLTANGGNGDGVVDSRDAIFGSLRLWQDTNHNGISEPEELKELSALNVKAFDLDFKDSKRTDRYGNEFRYRGKVQNTKSGSVGRWAWDVFLSH